MNKLLILAVFAQLLVTIVYGQDITTAECGKTKGCFRTPDGCSETTCEYLATYKANGADKIDFELLAKGADYVAIGFSDDFKMGDDSVIDCVYDSGSSKVKVQNSFNNGKSNNVLATNSQLGLSATSGTKDSTVVKCAFTRQMAVTGESKIYDLKNSFYLLLTRGTAANGNKNMHALSPLPEVSQGKIDFTSLKDSTAGKAYYSLIKAHGALMTLAWILTASIGLSIARFYKPVFSGKLMGKDVWFPLHQGMMGLTLILTIIAFIIIFVEVGGYTSQKGDWKNVAHPIVGIIVTLMVIINPVMAMFRPAPDAEKRYIFNYAHSFVGGIAHSIGLMNVVWGTMMEKAGAASWTFWITIAFIIFHVLWNIVIGCYKCCCPTETPGDVELHNVGSDNTAAEDKSKSKCCTLGPKEVFFRKIMLAIYVLVTVLFTVLTIVGLVVG